jgi:hypothetical protein
MSQPQSGSDPAQFAGKTMFYTEGNPAAMLVTNTAGRYSKRAMTFPTAEAALGWCRSNAATLVYFSVDLQRN